LLIILFERFRNGLCDDDDECSTQIDLGSIFDEHVIDVSRTCGEYLEDWLVS
jgi:hypothetical protein